ncbi:MAG: hypothetical protein K2N56_01610, partial [Oscillospiraceae bacterium]|nr:hypothetical protein [Oscillospiraceae bacterium]
PHKDCRLLPSFSDIHAALWGNCANILFASDYVSKFFCQRIMPAAKRCTKSTNKAGAMRRFWAKMTEKRFAQSA